ncbi:type I restriction-modification protein subunit S [Spirochaetia bacterium]|nr:type I restriction-modification protein subunit S [Spirochaetia bacterium]
MSKNMSTRMKPSGIEWIGDIPKDWKVKRLRYIAELKTGTTPVGNEGINYDENGFNWYTPGDFNPSLILSHSERYIEKDIIKREKIKLYSSGSVLLVGIGATVGKIGYCDHPVYSNQQITAIIPFNVFGKYLLYYTSSNTNYIRDNALYTTLPIINNEYLSNILICVPPISEQQAIASFLDERCEKIDGIIADMEQQVEVLKQYKTSLITETVTKGLDKSAPMKDSGIKWIGKIPKHWEVSKIKYSSAIIGSGTTPDSTNSDYYDGNLFWIQSGDLYQNISIKDTEKKISHRAVKENPTLKCFTKDFIVLAMYGASVGNCSISHIDAYVNQACCCIKPSKNVNLSYLFYFLEISKEEMLRKSIGGAQPNISQIIIKNLFVLNPPLGEQQFLVSFLDEKCSKVDALISEKQSSITAMKDYKKSLIYEYVTGKKRVTI